MTFLLT